LKTEKNIRRGPFFKQERRRKEFVMKKLASIMVGAIISALVLSSPVLCRERTGKAIRMESREYRTPTPAKCDITTMEQRGQPPMRFSESGWHDIDLRSISKIMPPRSQDTRAESLGYWSIILSVLRTILH